MDYKPGDFFISVIEFFGILVPGAILLFVHGQWITTQLGFQLNQFTEVKWVGFFLGAYVVGHFLFGVGEFMFSYLPLDNTEQFHQEVKDQLSKLPSAFIVPLQPSKTPTKASRLLQVWKARTNDFYRAYSFVRLNSLPAVEEIDRRMADYKFFRSLTLVFLLDLFFVWMQGNLQVPRGLFSLVLLFLALVRFYTLQNWTYRITFEYFALLKQAQLQDKNRSAGEQGAPHDRRLVDC